MPQFQLHADYDRDGRLSRSQGEYSQRQNRPGAIIVPNLDCDGAGMLPSTATDRPLPTLDCALPTKVFRDDDLTSIVIRVLERPREGRVILKIIGYNSKAVNLCDARGHVIHPQRNANTIFFEEPEYFLNLPPHVDEIRYKIEATRCSGSPLSHSHGLNSQAIIRSSGAELIRIEVIWQDAEGESMVCDWGYFTIAPFIFIDNTCQAQRLYMVEGVPQYENGPCENEPSLRGVREALPPQVGFVKLSYITGFGDTWIQDQFQLGYVQGAGRNHWMHLLLHLPRKNKNVNEDLDLDGTITNLSEFVNCHFPARNVGVFRDFVSNERPIAFYGDTYAGGQRSQALNFDQSHAVYHVLQTALSVSYLILEEIRRLGGTTGSPIFRSFSDAFNSITDLWSSLQITIERRREAPESSSHLRDHLDRLRDVFSSFINGVFDTITFDDGMYSINFSNISLEFEGDQINDIYRRLVRTFHQTNFGGNLEISPPVEGARLGKIVFGTDADFENNRLFDPNLLHFLYSQKIQQPPVLVDVGWLSSRHVDDILAFIPNPHRVEGQRFAIVRAAPGIGMQLIEAAKRRYIQGLDMANDPDCSDRIMHTERGTVNWPLFPSQRFTKRGRSPVTHMARGKRWLYKHTTGSLSAAIVPPRIYHYLAYADIYEQGRRNLFPLIPLRPGMGEDRYYRAGISVFEFSDNENGSNQFVENNYMTALDEQLGDEFPNIPIIPLPVLFDAMDQTFTEDSQNAWPHSSTASSADTTGGGENPQEREASDEEIYSLRTSAFIPNSINMQVVDNTLIIPKPYGPRMALGDTLEILREIFEQRALEGYDSYLTEEFLRSKGLIGFNYWVGVGGESPIEPLDIARVFVDGFPDRSLSEIAALVVDHPRNRNHFVMETRTTFHQNLVPETDDPLEGLEDEPETRTENRLRLASGCRELFIPEQTIDLFEAYVQVVLEPLGVSIHWVDSWYYHVRYGGLHCATNTLRLPRIATTGASTPWWYSVVEMEEELVQPSL